MNFDINKKKSNKKRIVFLALTLIMFLGVSLAAIYFVYVFNDERDNELLTGLISINFTEGSEIINLENQVPVIDEIGLENTPYTFTVKNTSAIPINVRIQLVPESDNTINLAAVRYAFYKDDKLIKIGNVDTKNNNTIYLLDNFEQGAIINGKLVFWVDYYYENPGEKFSAKIKVTGESFDIIYEETATDIIKTKLGTGGLVAVNQDGNLYDGTGEIREYRYSGTTVNNYVYFNCKDTDGTYNYGDTNYDYANNCEIWRIVGIFDDDGQEKIKLVKNEILTADVLSESYVIDGTTYTIANGSMNNTVYWNSELIGTNYSDWKTAGLQYYLNTESDEAETSNAGYLSFLSSSTKRLLSNATYYLGNVSPSKNTSEMYLEERDENNIWTGNQATWLGLVGLLYPSDYGYSYDSESWTTNINTVETSNSWMYNRFNESTVEGVWFLSPSSELSLNVIEFEMRYDNAMYSETPNPDMSDFNFAGNEVYPTVHLTPAAKLLKGTGTDTDPYVFIK